MPPKFIKYMMLYFFIYMLENYKKKIEWVGSHPVRVKNLRLMEFFSEFLQYAQEHTISMNRTYFCSCVRCLNQISQDFDTMRDHPFILGIVRSYTI